MLSFKIMIFSHELRNFYNVLCSFYAIYDLCYFYRFSFLHIVEVPFVLRARKTSNLTTRVHRAFGSSKFNQAIIRGSVNECYSRDKYFRVRERRLAPVLSPVARDQCLPTFTRLKNSYDLTPHEWNSLALDSLEAEFVNPFQYRVSVLMNINYFFN